MPRPPWTPRTQAHHELMAALSASVDAACEAEERMWEAARAFLIEIPVGAAEPGALLLFRMVANGPAKHCGILVPGPASQLTLIHARETTGVTREPFTLPWRRRAVAAFIFPG